MSRIGNAPVPIPSGVDVAIKGSSVTVKGPKGTLELSFADVISFEVVDGEAVVTRANEDRESKALHGLSRALLNNMVVGVSEGFAKELQAVGVGYRAALKGKTLELQVGYSHPVEFVLPEGVKAEVDKKQTAITLSSIDKQKLGQTAADIRAIRKPDAYKGKGVRYAGERVRLKAGKAAK